MHGPKTTRSPAPSTSWPRSPNVPPCTAMLCSALGKPRHRAGQGQPEAAARSTTAEDGQLLGVLPGLAVGCCLAQADGLTAPRHLARSVLTVLTTAHGPAIPLTRAAELIKYPLVIQSLPRAIKSRLRVPWLLRSTPCPMPTAGLSAAPRGPRQHLWVPQVGLGPVGAGVHTIRVCPMLMTFATSLGPPESPKPPSWLPPGSAPTPAPLVL